MGAKGWEQIPLIGWYREFGNLQAVSCTSDLYLMSSADVMPLYSRMAVTLSADPS